MIDIHSHILPGVDDGARTMEDSIEIARALSRQGVTDVIATPHFMVETTLMSTKTENLKLLYRLKEALRDQNIALNVHLGNEIYITEDIAELVSNGIISTLAGSEYLLIELPLSGQYANSEGIFESLIYGGFKVILAHPERYVIFQDDYDNFKRLSEIGVLFQCNIGSVLGQYGVDAKKTVCYMAKEGMIFAFGSDFHRARSSKDIIMAQKKLKRYLNKRAFVQAFETNPRKILVRGSLD